MKKLIDQADFGNVEQISKRWKKDTNTKQRNQPSANDSMTSDLVDMLNTTEKQNHYQDSNVAKSSVAVTDKQSHNAASDNNTINARKRQTIPQVIDEDTEHFRNRLEHLLNTFKTDAVSQFMGMKKDMLENQKDIIKADTQKYLTMYEQKHQQLLQTKQKLLDVSKQAEKKTIQCDLMSDHIAKLNQRIKITRYLSRPFALLYENKEREKMIKFKCTEACKADSRRLKYKGFNGWRAIFRDSKKVKQTENVQKRVNDEVKDIVSRFQKEIQILNDKLNESMKKNEEFESTKHMLQDNLKKAFLRGMTAMNMEAMGVLGDQDSANLSDLNNMTNLNASSLGVSQMDMMSMTQPKNIGQSMVNRVQLNQQSSFHQTSSSNINGNNSSVLLGKVKTESKQHRWRQAPIMGVEQNEECQQPRPIVIKPSTEGKVIKVVDGKSSTIDPKKKNMSGLSHTGSSHQQTSRSNLNNSRKKA